ncbi:MAG TPA: helix-turn-helix transcriptional regulator [Bradyrhizobium sp.]|uniref:AraC family transcriptional regulator n=1 Tax=Bradyrhizobium sp. TaxID=376 RepID=UPI002B98DFB3|nr:helix-turn-helix transcriptional regulator [Bradyrhizobium sp.]HLZ01852.1 helix-turn-helix transcriptional regulator [Bradyrhizobium sp.]
MTIVEAPIHIVPDDRRSTGGLHLVARSYKKGTRLDPHMHRESQLVYAARGTMQVTTPKGRWLVPPDRAVWVPARFAHAIDVLADIEMRTLYFDLSWLKRERLSAGLKSEFVVRVSPLLHQAIVALFDKDNAPERTALLIRLVMLELHRAEDSATFIPLPQEVRCRRAADIVLAAPGAAHDIDTLAQKVGTSARTLSRLFAAETQLSFKSWCQRARIAAAVQKLSVDGNVSVKHLAADLGYASVPAFSHAFRQITGKTPTEFVETK